jgi:hypothetical protein
LIDEFDVGGKPHGKPLPRRKLAKIYMASEEAEVIRC